MQLPQADSVRSWQQFCLWQHPAMCSQALSSSMCCSWPRLGLTRLACAGHHREWGHRLARQVRACGLAAFPSALGCASVAPDARRTRRVGYVSEGQTIDSEKGAVLFKVRAGVLCLPVLCSLPLPEQSCVSQAIRDASTGEPLYWEPQYTWCAAREPCWQQHAHTNPATALPMRSAVTTDCCRAAAGERLGGACTCASMVHGSPGAVHACSACLPHAAVT